jgi:hypothetical protein
MATNHNDMPTSPVLPNFLFSSFAALFSGNKDREKLSWGGKKYQNWKSFFSHFFLFSDDALIAKYHGGKGKKHFTFLSFRRRLSRHLHPS